MCMHSSLLLFTPQFYDGTVSVSPDDLRNFVYLWWDTCEFVLLLLCSIFSSYGHDLILFCIIYPYTRSQDGDFIASSSKNITLKEKVLCAKITNNPNDQTICQVNLAYGGNWAAFIDQMLYEASVAYGDADFNTRAADQSGKLKAVKNMNLIVQSAVCPTARSNGVNTTDITYAGPNNDPFNEMYTPTIPAAYVVDSGAWWFGAGDGNDGKVFTVSSPPPNTTFQLGDWDDYYLDPSKAGEGELLIPSSSNDRVLAGSPITPLKEPFDSKTSVIQAASATSAYIGIYSPIVPSIFAQQSKYTLSLLQAKNDGGNTSLTAPPSAANELYNADAIYNLAICSQWPNLCEGESDYLYFIDGGYQDPTGLAYTIGQYQSTAEATLDLNFKVILTNTNSKWDNYSRQIIMQHFSTSFNANIEPGDFFWDPVIAVPTRSYQIFEDYMNATILDALIQQIEGSNMTTVLLSGTTIDNQAYKVRKGQKVEMLIVNTNANIPTTIASSTMIEEYKVPLGDMAVDIATNTVLKDRVQAFLEEGTTTKPQAPITSSLGNMEGVHRIAFIAIVLLMYVL